MSVPAPGQIIFEPCWFVKDPTDISAGQEYPFGGTELGFCEHILFDRGVERVRLIGQEFGGRKTVRSSYVARSAILSCDARGWDPDLLALLPGGSSGGSITGGSPTGCLSRIKLLLVPESDRKANARNLGVGLILYAGSPLMMGKPVRSHSGEYIQPLEWEAELDDTGRDWKEGRLSTFTL